ncbi:MAG: hypothetical protein PF692_09875 [Kiritimatiellae bacterium]|nr:hypothetical protein [Kiritimatiellia bacterium]
MSKKQEINLRIGLNVTAVILLTVSATISYKSIKNIDKKSEILKQRVVTVEKLKELYNELEPLMSAKAQLIKESTKRDVSEIDTIMKDLSIANYEISENSAIQQENFDFVTKTVTIKEFELINFKSLMDALMNEWPYINVQRVQMSSTQDGFANISLKLLITTPTN